MRGGEKVHLLVSPPCTPLRSFHVRCLPRLVLRTVSLLSHLSEGMAFSVYIEDHLKKNFFSQLQFAFTIIQFPCGFFCKSLVITLLFS